MGENNTQTRANSEALMQAAMHETKAAFYGIAALSAGVMTLASLPLTRAATFSESYYTKTANGNKPKWNNFVFKVCALPTRVAARITLKCMDLLRKEQAKTEALYAPASEWPRLFFEPREELYAGYDALRAECKDMNLILPDRSYVFNGVLSPMALPLPQNDVREISPAVADEETVSVDSSGDGPLHKFHEQAKGVLDTCVPVIEDKRHEAPKYKVLEARKEEGVWISSPPLVLKAEKPTASIEAEVKVKPKAKSKEKAKFRPKTLPKKVAHKIAKAKAAKPKKPVLKRVVVPPAPLKAMPVKARKKTAKKAPVKKLRAVPKKQALKKAVRRKAVLAAITMDPPSDKAIRTFAANVSAVVKSALQTTLETAGSQAIALKDKIRREVKAARTALQPPVKIEKAGQDLKKPSVPKEIKKAGHKPPLKKEAVKPEVTIEEMKDDSKTVDIEDVKKDEPKEIPPVEASPAPEEAKHKIGMIYNKSSNDNRSSKLPPFEKISRGVVVSRR